MFFYLSKVFWFFTQPSSLLLLSILIGGLLAARGRARLGSRLIFSALAFIAIIAVSPLSDVLFSTLERRFPRAVLDGSPLDAIVVLGGAEDGNSASRELMGLNESAERMTEGAALALRLPGVPLVFSGGSAAILGEHSNGAEEALALFRALGVDVARIRLEDRSRTTYENAVETKALLPPQSGRPILLVTSAWHMPRAVGVFRAVGYDVRPWPVDYRAPARFAWIRLSHSIPDGLRRFDGIVREYVGLVGYRLSGRTKMLLPAPL